MALRDICLDIELSTDTCKRNWSLLSSPSSPLHSQESKDNCQNRQYHNHYDAKDASHSRSCTWEQTRHNWPQTSVYWYRSSIHTVHTHVIYAQYLICSSGNMQALYMYNRCVSMHSMYELYCNSHTWCGMHGCAVCGGGCGWGCGCGCVGWVCSVGWGLCVRE